MEGSLYDPKEESSGFEDEFEKIPPVSQPRAEIKGGNLRLRHRIGRGPLGDVWLGTLHSHREEFDEHHEVAVKVLPSLPQEHACKLSTKLEEVVAATQGASHSVSWPLGFTSKDGKVSVVSKLYESSVADKMAFLPDNSLPLADAIRYGLDIVEGLREVHSRGLLALNLKPSNFFIDEHDKAALGEFGIPFLLMNVVSSGGAFQYLGTPNYMAPEQWDAKLRGPVSSQTDSWGLGCSIVEMLSGVKPWNHMTAPDIFKAVVIHREKPAIPSGLPAALHKVLRRCFEYDYRDRPVLSEVSCALSSPRVSVKEGDWVSVPHKQGVRIGVVKKVKGTESIVVQHCDKPEEPVEYIGLSKCNLWEPFQMGYGVRLKALATLPTFTWKGPADAVGSISGIDNEKGVFLVTFEGRPDSTSKADPSQLDLVYEGFCAGDWVRNLESWSGTGGTDTDAGRLPSSVGVVHRVSSRKRSLSVAFLGREMLLECSPEGRLEKVTALEAGQFVRLRAEVVEPRFEWPLKAGRQGWETGKICRVLPNGAVEVSFPGRLWNRKRCFADAEEVEVVRLSECEGVVAKLEQLRAVHWAVTPALCLLGFLAALRVGSVIGSFAVRPLRNSRKDRCAELPPPSLPDSSSPSSSSGVQLMEGNKVNVPAGVGNPVWLPPTVAGILFKEGAAAS